MAGMPGLSTAPICESSELRSGGLGVRFVVTLRDESTPAFVIRHESGVSAYVNRCAHIPVELDWAPGQFFDNEGVYLICATHGAVYGPASGLCLGGPCNGRSLEPVAVEERDGHIFLKVIE